MDALSLSCHLLFWWLKYVNALSLSGHLPFWRLKYACECLGFELSLTILVAKICGCFEFEL